MSALRCTIGCAVLVVVCGVSLLGCPFGLVRDLALLPDTDTLDFGGEADSLTLHVTKTPGSGAMRPLVVTPTASWVIPEQCLALGDGCTSRGPLDPIAVPVRVDRGRMHLGHNTAELLLQSEGAATEVVEVWAQAVLVPEFRAYNRTPQPGAPVQFHNCTQSAFPPDQAIQYRWDFGDGSASTVRNPLHSYTAEGAYTVRLTALSGGKTVTAVREAFVLVGGRSPVADFEVSAYDAFVGEPLVFMDRSSSGVTAITSWLWDFGDGATSSNREPAHAYAAPGAYTVSLTVANAYGSSTAAKPGLVLIKKRVAPHAAFTVSNAYATEPAQFTDLSTPGTMPVKRWAWSFGDGSSSTLQNPVHTYAQPGVYHVALTVETNHGSDTCAEDVAVDYAPLEARFHASPERALINDAIQFTDTSLHGQTPILSRLWSFGDGATSNEAHPAHAYARPGRFTVALTVTSAAGSDTLTRTEYITVAQPTVLDDYVRREDPSYAYSLARTLSNYGVKAHVLSLTSQQWRTADEVDKPLWKHWLTIIEPPEVEHATALLAISGGSNERTTPPNTFDAVLAQLALDTRTIVAIIEQVPSEPLVFADETDPRYITRGRTEDEIIAYTFDRYLRTGDATWPLLLPMVKSVVRGMDAIQSFLAGSRSITVDDFVVAGASKRGWTAWLTAAADARVRAVAPIVIDVLNIDVQMDHQRAVYGAYSEAIGDYADLNVFMYLNTPEGQSLLHIVDPYEYRGRLVMPKLPVNSTGDEFFLPDSAQFYFNGLPGEKHLAYIPNTNHGMGGYSNVIQAIAPWYMSLLANENRPVFFWDAPDDTRIDVWTAETPEEVLLWTAASPNRDFRMNTQMNPKPPVWSAAPLSAVAANWYRAEPPRLDTAWTGFFVELRFPSRYIVGGLTRPFSFCTELRVAPPLLPQPPAADFNADNQVPVTGQPVRFEALVREGTAPIHTWEWSFGDGASSNLRDPVHTYAAPGAYTVSLAVASLDGSDTKVKTGYIRVEAGGG